MTIAAILAILQTVVTELPGAISTVEQLYDLGKKFFAATNGRDPTPNEVTELRAAIDADVAEALTPLPDPQPGDPDYVPPTT